jgi:hypothetical protein
MSRVFEQYSTEDKIQILLNSNSSSQSRLNDAHYDIETLQSALGGAIELLERASKGKPYKRDYKLFKKYLQLEEI